MTVCARVLNPSVVSPPTGTETTWEDQYHIKLDEDDDDDDDNVNDDDDDNNNNNNNNNIFKYALISTGDKFKKISCSLERRPLISRGGKFSISCSVQTRSEPIQSPMHGITSSFSGSKVAGA